MRIPRLLATMTHDLPEERQLVVYNESGEKLIVLNDVGAAVYFLIDGTRKVEEITRFVQETLPDTDAESCARDVEDFLAKLETHGVITWASPAPLPFP